MDSVLFVEEFVPRGAAGVDDGVGVVEDADREEALSEVEPQTLDGIELGTVGRREDQSEVLRDVECPGVVPTGAVEDDRDVDVLGQGGGEAGEEQVHEIGIDGGEHESEVGAARRMHDGIDIGPLVADLPGPPGALSPAPPAMADPPLVADAGLVLKPELDALAGMGLANRLQARAKPPFLKLSSASGSFFAWAGRIFWRDKSRRRSIRPIEEG